MPGGRCAHSVPRLHSLQSCVSAAGSPGPMLALPLSELRRWQPACIPFPFSLCHPAAHRRLTCFPPTACLPPAPPLQQLFCFEHAVYQPGNVQKL